MGDQRVADNYTGLFNEWLTHHPDRDWIDKLFLYHAGDDEYGVFNPDGSPRPAYGAIRDFVASRIPGRACVAPACAALDGFEAGSITLAAIDTPLTYRISDIRAVTPRSREAAAAPEPTTLVLMVLGGLLLRRGSAVVPGFPVPVTHSGPDAPRRGGPGRP